jgi:four helix bundle protein
MTITTYRDLEVWNEAMNLTEHVYRLTPSLPQNEQYGLSSQLKRASVSVPSNIAEGHGRKGSKEFLHHLSIARGSLCELETQVILSVRLNFVSKEAGEHVWNQCQTVGKLLNGLIRSLK